MSTNLMSAHNQWASRPADERFWGLEDLGQALHDTRSRSYEREVPGGQIQTVVIPGNDGADLGLVGNKGPALLTHWSFNQLCTYAGAPASYLRSLPPELAVSNLNHGLHQRRGDRAQLLLHDNRTDKHQPPAPGNWTLRSILTDSYARLWNEDVINALTPALDLGWMVPPARPSGHDPRARRATVKDVLPNQSDFGLSVKVGDMIAPAGVYASDRDMFIFLVNPTRIVDDGVGGLMRGVFIWNSETGAGAFKVQAFYLENVCGNHIVWGASGIKTARVVHKGKAIKAIGGTIGNQLREYAQLGTTAETNMIAAARNHVIGKNKEEVIETLYKNRTINLTKNELTGIWETAEKWEHTAKSAPNTAWCMAHAATRYSQLSPYADQRTKMDSAAGRILELAAKAGGVNTKLLGLPAPR